MSAANSKFFTDQHVKALELEDLPNELWLQLLDYLPFSDKLQLRLVCKRWQNLVTLPEFMRKMKIFIDAKNLSEIVHYVHKGAMNIVFENVELRHLAYSPELGKLLATIGPQVRMFKVDNSFSMALIYKPELDATPDSDAQQNKEIETISLSLFDRLTGVELNCYSFYKNVKRQLLRELKSHPSNGAFERLGFSYTSENSSLVLQVLSDNAATLNYVDLYFSSVPKLRLKNWSRIFARTDKLSTLKLSGNCPFEVLSTILVSLSAVAPICHIDLSGILTLNAKLLEALAEKWSSTLEFLELMFCVQLNDSCETAFKKLRPKLRTLSVAYCRELTSTCLINGLAYETNTTLQELHLEEIWTLHEADICMFAERLPNLCKLSMNNCQKSVTDKSLAAIFKHQTSLQELFFDNCNLVTDDGLVGFGDQPYPISRLRGLRVLSIRGLPHPSNRTLEFALRFPELRTLKLGYNKKYSGNGIEQLTINCPAVDKLAMTSCSLLDDHSVEHIARNMKRLRVLNLSHCEKLTELCLDLLAEHCDNLEELALCGIEALRMRIMDECLYVCRSTVKGVTR